MSWEGLAGIPTGVVDSRSYVLESFFTIENRLYCVVNRLGDPSLILRLSLDRTQWEIFLVVDSQFFTSPMGVPYHSIVGALSYKDSVFLRVLFIGEVGGIYSSSVGLYRFVLTQTFTLLKYSTPVYFPGMQVFDNYLYFADKTRFWIAMNGANMSPHVACYNIITGASDTIPTDVTPFIFMRHNNIS